MTDKENGRFEGMVMAKLGDMEERLDELLRFVREIQGRCMREQSDHAVMVAEVRGLREKTTFLTRALWGAVAWVVVAAAGLILAAVRLNG